METRILDRTIVVSSSDGRHTEIFNRGERVKDIRRIGTRVMFEPADVHHVAGTYVMDWAEFEKNTTVVRGAKA
jgi:hypothetical protein